MKQYLLFVGQNYYPKGGFSDYYGSYDTLEETLKIKDSLLTEDWWEIVDSKTLIVTSGSYNYK